MSCLHCNKYIFDDQNISVKRMSTKEYVDGVIRRLEKTNKPLEEICKEKKFHIDWLINKSQCELCGAPHAVFSDPSTKMVVHILFFFSGHRESSEKDKRFIQDFRHQLFHS